MSTTETIAALLNRQDEHRLKAGALAVRLDAELKVAEAYDRHRAAGYMDTTGSRRGRALTRLTLEAQDARRRAALAGATILDADDTDVVMAFRRFAAAKINRWDTSPQVRNALRATALELDTDATLASLGVAATPEREERRR